MGTEVVPSTALELRYRKLVETLPSSVVFVLDRNLVVTFAGGGLVAKSAFLPGAYLQRSLRDIVPPVIFAGVASLLQSTFAGEENCFELPYPSGAVFQVCTTPLAEESGSIAEILVIVLEITQRKRAEHAEQAAQQRLQLAIHAANVGLWDWDLQTNRVHYSHEWKLQLGCTDDEVGDSLDEWERRVHPDDLLRARAAAMAYLAAPWPNFEQEFRMLHKDGTYRWILAQGSVYLDTQGRPLHMLGSHIDITEKKRSEEALQRQERLAAVGQLAAGIAHDFNNIMSVISIYAELTSAAPELNPVARARMQTVVDQAQRATRMIHQILDFSRQSVYARQAIDLLPLLKEEIKLLKQTLPETIAVELVAPRTEFFVHADPTRMQQLVMNLAVNARDAMPQGGTLKLELAHVALDPAGEPPLPEMAPGWWVCLKVGDTGCGIADADLAHIFEPFFTTKARDKGAGLGLAQVHGIVAQHDGFAAVTSAVGAGTTFTIYLPAQAAPAVLTAPVPQAAQVALLPHGHGEQIMVVEDDAGVRSSVVALLELLNYRVTAAPDGAAALAELLDRQLPIDLIVSDVIMPRLDGINLVKALRQAGRQTPVILMTGYTADGERAALLDGEVAAWLDKPPSSWVLACAVAEAMARGRSLTPYEKAGGYQE